MASDDLQSQTHRLSAFRPVPRTGVIFVTQEATRLGFGDAPDDWCNLGQGQPETGPLPGSPPRQGSIEIHPDDQEYAPVAGLPELRQAVADLYNKLYRVGKASQYTAENVCIAGGGRMALTRAAASLGRINLGHFLPDYTAYEELLDVFGMFNPIPILLDPKKAYAFTAQDLRDEILGRGLGAVLMSNPCNPTGRSVTGDALDGWVSAARDLDCALLVDEFYSHYQWSEERTMESAARYVENVNEDPVVIFDGLTKNWRYPGWRCGWIVGPKKVIDACASAGSFLDGGGSRPLQAAAVKLLEPSFVQAETDAIRASFGKKRALALELARSIGLTIDVEPEGTFYLWANLSSLPEPLNDGMNFFRAALEHKVICVPGEFFGVNPGRRRSRPSRFRQHVRLSFGPSEEIVREGFKRLGALIEEARNKAA